MNKFLAASALFALLIPAPAFAAGQVVEAKLGKGVADRNIVDETTTFASGDRAHLWMKVEEASGETLTVTWKIHDLSFPAELAIGGSPWRTWASKTLHVSGEWTVTVTDSAGATLHEAKFTVQ